MIRRVVVVAACATLGACATAPPPPAPQPEPPRLVAPVPDSSSARHAAIARHEKLARAARESGDLADAAEHYAVLVLLEPGNAAYREALRATEAAIDAAIEQQVRVAAAARKAGEVAKAREAWLRVLALDPNNAEAAKALREIEHAAMARTQAERAARARSMDEIVASAKARASAENASGFDLDQRIELVRSSDASIAVREARAWGDANPNDHAGRLRLATALAERAKDVDRKGQREWALALYDQAVQLGGPAQAESGKRAAVLRKVLADEAYAEGMRARSSDLNAAIRHWETALRYDPQHGRARDRLREARAAQQKLERIGGK